VSAIPFWSGATTRAWLEILAFDRALEPGERQAVGGI
jgi:hypothetical protein